MIPLTLVTGFLGSGKTTLLQHLARRNRDRKIVWLVNEFSARDMDAARLADATSDIVSIAGGSIFCRCKAAEFLDQLGSLPGRFAPEAVVIEASGMADPVVAGKMLRESRLDRLYEIAAIIAVVDPGSFLKLLHTLPNIRAQIEAATLVLLNKTDLHPPDRVEEAEAAVRALNPSAPVVRTQYCAADCDLVVACGTVPSQGELAPCVDPRFVKFELPLSGEMEIGWLVAAAEPVRDEIYRIKGVVRSGGRSVRVDYSLAGWHIEESPADPSPELVLIARGPCSNAVRDFVQKLGKYEKQASTPHGQGSANE